MVCYGPIEKLYITETFWNNFYAGVSINCLCYFKWDVLPKKNGIANNFHLRTCTYSEL